MLKANSYKALFSVILVSLLIAGCASPKTQEAARTNVDEAQTTLANFLRDPDMTWLQRNIHNAKAVLVSPNILQAGFVFGGSGGSAVVLARNGRAPEGWNGPAFYKVGTGSVGFQAGAQSSEMVVLVMNDKALNSLLSTSVKLGGDISIAAGPIGAGAGAPVNSDMVAFVRSKGLYGGVNLNGTVISVDDKGNQAFYGRPASPVDILIKRSVTSPYGASLARVASNPGTASGSSPSGTSRSSGSQ